MLTGFLQGAGTPHTVYKGNKKPTAKECVLIIDHETGTYTLEKLDQNVFVKKTRYLRWPNTPVFSPKTYIKSVLIVKFNMSRCSGNKN
jgi:hypothetical protein